MAETKRFVNQKGMSLVTVMVGIAITSIMALAMASIAHNMSRVQETAKLRENAMTTTFLISSFLQDRDVCKQSLLGASASGLALSSVEASSGRQISKIVTSSSQSVLTAGNNSPDGVKRMYLEPIKQDKSLARAPLAQSRYLAQLRIEFEQKKGLLGGGVSERTIPIFLTLNDSNRAIECRAISDGAADDSTVNEMELLFASPHMDPSNCQGQYYRRSSRPSSVNELSAPVDPKTRFQLLTKSPPAYSGNNSSDGNGYGKRYSRDPAVAGSQLSYNGGTPVLAGEMRQIDGVQYYVTPTLRSGWVGGASGNNSGCAPQYVCSGGMVGTSDVGHHCGGGNR